MLTAIERDQIPAFGGHPRSPIRQFALETVKEFLDISHEGDVYEVTGYPEMEGAQAERQRGRIAQAIGTELRHFEVQCEVRVFRRGCRIFLERDKEHIDKAIAARKAKRTLGDYWNEQRR